jgi:hypothetical protein
VKFLKYLLFVSAVFLVACEKTDENALKAKVDKCTEAGMNFSYLLDFRGNPYDVMCVAKRLR